MKKAIIILLLLSVTLFLSSCYDSKEVDDMIYILSVGIDTLNDKTYNYTFQTVIPLNISSGVETGFGKSEEKATLSNITVPASNLYEALNRANQTVSKEINLSHCRLILLSENFAKKGIKKQIEYFKNDPDIRSNTLIAITKSKAIDFLNSVSSPYELVPSRFFEKYFSKEYIPDSISAKLSDFYEYPVTIVPLVKTDGEIEAEIFKNFLPEGRLSAEETIFYNIVSNSFNSGYITVNQIDTPLKFHLHKKTKIKIDIRESTPKIKVIVNLSGALPYDQKNIKELSNFVEKYFENGIYNLLIKTSKKIKTDVFMLSEIAESKFLTKQAFDAYNWNGKLQNADFTVEFNLNVMQ